MDVVGPGKYSLPVLLSSPTTVGKDLMTFTIGINSNSFFSSEVWEEFNSFPPVTPQILFLMWGFLLLICCNIYHFNLPVL